MAEKYISRKVACNLSFSHGLNEDGILYIPYHEVINYLRNISPADVRPVKKGKWIEVGNNQPLSCDTLYGCSRCQTGRRLKSELTNFCPNCGADMTGGADE